MRTLHRCQRRHHSQRLRTRPAADLTPRPSGHALQAVGGNSISLAVTAVYNSPTALGSANPFPVGYVLRTTNGGTVWQNIPLLFTKARSPAHQLRMSHHATRAQLPLSLKLIRASSTGSRGHRLSQRRAGGCDALLDERPWHPLLRASGLQGEARWPFFPFAFTSESPGCFARVVLTSH